MQSPRQSQTRLARTMLQRTSIWGCLSVKWLTQRDARSSPFHMFKFRKTTRSSRSQPGAPLLQHLFMVWAQLAEPGWILYACNHVLLSYVSAATWELLFTSDELQRRQAYIWLFRIDNSVSWGWQRLPCCLSYLVAELYVLVVWCGWFCVEDDGKQTSICLIKLIDNLNKNWSSEPA